MSNIEFPLQATIYGDEGSGQARARALYRDSDPWAVEFQFLQQGRWVSWVFSRDALFDGSTCSVEHSDVQVTYAYEGYVAVRFSVGEWKSWVTFNRRDVERFLWWTEKSVARGDESKHVDWVLEFPELGVES